MISTLELQVTLLESVVRASRDKSTLRLLSSNLYPMYSTTGLGHSFSLFGCNFGMFYLLKPLCIDLLAVADFVFDFLTLCK
jgi:hypothetical protein